MVNSRTAIDKITQKYTLKTKRIKILHCKKNHLTKKSSKQGTDKQKTQTYRLK